MADQFQSLRTQHRLRSLDFLRGIAILGVIFVHTSQRFPSHSDPFDFLFGLGRFGVQLFYLISAFTMCYMWEQRKSEPKRIYKFYLRRVLRIAPLFWLAIPTYLYLNGLGSSYWAPEGIGIRHIFLTVTFLHGFWPDSINSVVPGGWSIAVEMTFYLIFPFLILMLRNNKTYYLIAAFTLWLFNTLIFQNFLTNFFSENYQTDSTTIVKDFLYLNFINQAPVFLLGCYVYFCVQTGFRRADTILIAVWLALTMFETYMLQKSGLGFLALTILLSLFVFISVRKNLRFRPFEILGEKSYSIYLSHFWVLSVLNDILPYKLGPIPFLVGLSLTIILGADIDKVEVVTL